MGITGHNGNLLSKVGYGEQMNLGYNALNQVVHADITTAGGASSVDYVYDHDGIRVGKTINGSHTITYLVDKNRPYAQVLEEQHTQGAVSATVNYVYGHGLISQTVDGRTHYYHPDGFQSIRALSDLNGTVTDTYTDDAYGNGLQQTGDTVNPYRYRGESFDAELDAYYLRARYYQPGVGRFTSMDPVEGDINVPRSWHRYLYAHNDPINYIDPSGEKATYSEMAMVSGIIGILAGTGVGVLRR